MISCPISPTIFEKIILACILMFLCVVLKTIFFPTKIKCLLTKRLVMNVCNNIVLFYVLKKKLQNLRYKNNNSIFLPFLFFFPCGGVEISPKQA